MTKKRTRTKKHPGATEAADATTSTHLQEEAPPAETSNSDEQTAPGSAEPLQGTLGEEPVSADLDRPFPDTPGPDVTEARLASRHSHRVNTVVHVRESADESWREVIEVATVSRNGAGMLLSRPCPIGRIVSLVMEMPTKLRAYDQFAEVYPIAGVVQNCMELMQDDTLAYHVGVAFIGKQLPESFRQDPTTTYRIIGVNPDGLWRVSEMQKGFQDREHMRYWTQIVMSLTYRDEAQKRTERAAVETRDISRGGMAVWGPLGIEVGDRVKVSNKEHDFISMATVKNRTDHPKEDSRSLVHIQFEQEFPVEVITRGELDGASASE